jgi:predicted nuclease with TOPRIM domain
MSPTDLLEDFEDSEGQSPPHARTSPLVDLSCNSKEEELEYSTRLHMSFEDEPEFEYIKHSPGAQPIGGSPMSSIHTFRSQEPQPAKGKPSPSFAKPPIKFEEKSETSRVLELHQVSMSVATAPLTSSPETPSWFKVNNLLRQHGFQPIAIEHDENLQAVPDFSSLAETLIDILNKYEKRGHKLQDLLHANVSQRFTQELGSCRRELEAVSAENSKLKSELERERVTKREDSLQIKQQLTDLDKHNRVLRNKLESTKQVCSQRDSQINELKAQLNMKTSNKVPELLKTIGPEREREVFRRFFNREFRPTSGQDAKVMGLIMMYEEQRIQKTPEAVPDKKLEKAYQELEQKFHETLAQLDRFKRERSLLEGQRHAVSDEVSTLRAELRERPTIREFKALQEQVRLYEEHVSSRQTVPADKVAELSGEQAKKVVYSIAELLCIKNTHNLVPSVDKMQRVVRAVPKLEQFIKGICSEVFPNDPDFGAGKMEQVLPTVKRWKFQLEYLDSLKAFRAQVCQLAGLDGSSEAPDFDIVRVRQLRALKAPPDNKVFTHLQSLFDIEREEDVLPAINQIYLFVVEMKALVKYLRETLRLDCRTPVSVVVQRLKQTLD